MDLIRLSLIGSKGLKLMSGSQSSEDMFLFVIISVYFPYKRFKPYRVCTEAGSDECYPVIKGFSDTPVFRGGGAS